MASFSLFDLGQALNAGAGAVNQYRQQRSLADLGGKLQSGDFEGAAKTALAAGDVGTGLELLKLGMTRKANAEAERIAGGGAGLSGAVSSPAPIGASDGRGASNSDFLPMFAQAGTRYGVSPGYLSRTAQIESGMNPNAHNASGADGLMQFVPTTAKQYGLNNPRDPNAAIDAAARLASDNKRVLVASLGRNPSDAELYLAHQQGAEGAAKLLANPNAPAVNIVGRQAVIQNGGRTDMTAGEFAGMWINKYGGAPQQFGQQNVADASGGVPQSSGDAERAALDRTRTQIESALAVEGISPAKERALKTGLESINRRITELAPTAGVKEYNLAKQQGFQGSFMDFKKASAPSQQVNFQQEKEYEKTVGKGYGEIMLELQKAGRSAPSAITSLNLLEKATQTPGYYSGSAEPLINAVRKAAVALDVADAANAAPNEIFAKVSNKLVFDLAGGSLGTGFSNADRDYLAGTVPNLANTPEGNRQIIGIMKAVEGRKVEIAKLARDYAKANNGRIDAGFDDQLSQWAEANPLFKGSPAPQAQQQKLRAPAANELSNARTAISRGADRAVVIKWMQDNGVDPGGL